MSVLLLQLGKQLNPITVTLTIQTRPVQHSFQSAYYDEKHLIDMKVRLLLFIVLTQFLQVFFIAKSLIKRWLLHLKWSLTDECDYLVTVTEASSISARILTKLLATLFNLVHTLKNDTCECLHPSRVHLARCWLSLTADQRNPGC